MRTYYYNKQNNILETKVKGNLSITDIINHYLEISKSEYPTKHLQILIDCREADFEITPIEISYTVNALKRALINYDSIQESILVNKPFETAVATLFRRYNSNTNNYFFKVFCTENAAKSWL